MTARSDDKGIKQSQIGFYAQDQIKLGLLSFLLGGRQDFATTDLDNVTSTGLPPRRTLRHSPAARR